MIIIIHGNPPLQAGNNLKDQISYIIYRLILSYY